MAYLSDLLFRLPPDELEHCILLSRRGWAFSGQAFYWRAGQAVVAPYVDARPWTPKDASGKIYVFIETTKGVLWLGNYVENQKPIRFLSDDERTRLLAALVDFVGHDNLTIEEPCT